MLMLNCYYRLRSEDYNTHWGAIDDTYAKNKALVEPLDMSIAIGICDVAMQKYTESNDEKQIEAAKKRGYTGAGLNYTSRSLIEKLAITDKELQHMKRIKLG